MKIFLDSNVWISAFTTRGLCEELVRTLLRRHGRGGIEVVLSPPVRLETLRILTDKFHALESDLVQVRVAMDEVSNTPAQNLDPPVAIPDPDDVAVVGSALASGATLFVTGDKALQDLEKIGDMVILSPRQLFERLIAQK